ncbi:MAG: sugar transferase [Tepidisphaeraceae bacterium]|jgi:lipopolysaccharide/colanic/teichoic acid biosynthesis glycosyltransferase
MIALAPELAQSPAVAAKNHTIWGLDPLALHHRYWAARGIQVVRQGEPSEIVRDAELYLLTDPRSLVLFRMGSVIETLNWLKPTVLFLRLHDDRERGYRERVITDNSNRFIRFQRLYDTAADLRLARAVLTPDREVARLWQASPDPLSGWRRLRRYTPRHERVTLSVDGRVFDRSLDQEIAVYLRHLMTRWSHPDSTIDRALFVEPEVWKDPKSSIDPDARFIGPVWVGAGRHVAAGTTVIGPAIIWDDPNDRPPTQDIQWLTIEPSEIPQAAAIRDSTASARLIKRSFDVVFSLIALALTLPLYPFIILAIWLEDGGPFFFTHDRETMGGNEFPCIKFRSMRKDAEKMKEQLRNQNKADGPQFYIPTDPRLTRVGAVLRKYDLDELPQFINVLLGQMSVVGPRPSPRVENQYCPPWREARLSVRPGITGLWQIHRTRQSGSDFQEWIKYDIEYVENRGLMLDLWIIWKTMVRVFRKVTRS